MANSGSNAICEVDHDHSAMKGFAPDLACSISYDVMSIQFTIRTLDFNGILKRSIL